MCDGCITLSKRSASAYLHPEEPILLHKNGTLTCGGIVVHDRTRTRYLRRQHRFIYEYLKKKTHNLDVSEFCKRNLGDVITEMQGRKQKVISERELVDIYSYQNQIASIRDHHIERIERIAQQRWWRKYTGYLDTDYKKVYEMKDDFEKKRKVAHEIINSRL